jgi:hypothetical protein
VDLALARQELHYLTKKFQFANKAVTDEMEKFLERHKLLTLSKEEIEELKI